MRLYLCVARKQIDATTAEREEREKNSIPIRHVEAEPVPIITYKKIKILKIIIKSWKLRFRAGLGWSEADFF